MKKHDVAVVGEVYIDHIFTGFAHWPQPGEEVFTRHYAREIGGGAVNTACALARLGRSVRLFGVIGAADAEWFESRLRAFNVSGDNARDRPRAIPASPSASPCAMTGPSSATAGENEKLAPMLRSEAMLASLRNARHVHFALPLAHDLAMDLLPALRAAGCTTSLDVGFQAEWLHSPANLETCRAMDYLFPNEKEAALLSGGRDAIGYLSFARQNGFPRPVVKLGPRGAAMFANDGTLRSVLAPCRNRRHDRGGRCFRCRLHRCASR